MCLCERERETEEKQVTTALCGKIPIHQKFKTF